MGTMRILLCVSALAGCTSIPPGSPEEVAPRIVVLLDQGKTEDADDLFDAMSSEGETLYPLLYETARSRYELGDAHGSAAVLRFMARQYPASAAVREALVYSLFVERAGVEEPSVELVQEFGAAIARLQEGSVQSTSWLDLAQAQQAIDRGDLGVAREAFARFRRTAAETSPQLTIYIEDIERYLGSHP